MNEKIECPYRPGSVCERLSQGLECLWEKNAEDAKSIGCPRPVDTVTDFMTTILHI